MYKNEKRKNKKKPFLEKIGLKNKKIVLLTPVFGILNFLYMQYFGGMHFDVLTSLKTTVLLFFAFTIYIYTTLEFQEIIKNENEIKQAIKFLFVITSFAMIILYIVLLVYIQQAPEDPESGKFILNYVETTGFPTVITSVGVLISLQDGKK